MLGGFNVQIFADVDVEALVRSEAQGGDPASEVEETRWCAGCRCAGGSGAGTGRRRTGTRKAGAGGENGSPARRGITFGAARTSGRSQRLPAHADGLHSSAPAFKAGREKAKAATRSMADRGCAILKLTR